MSDILFIISGFIGGLLIGFGYFGSLHWTIGKIIQVKHPARLLLVSFLLRTTFALLAFAVIANDSWQRLLLALVGFVVARMILVRVLTFSETNLSKEVNATHGTQS